MSGSLQTPPSEPSTQAQLAVDTIKKVLLEVRNAQARIILSKDEHSANVLRVLDPETGDKPRLTSDEGKMALKAWQDAKPHQVIAWLAKAANPPKKKPQRNFSDAECVALFVVYHTKGLRRRDGKINWYDAKRDHQVLAQRGSDMLSNKLAHLLKKLSEGCEATRRQQQDALQRLGMSVKQDKATSSSLPDPKKHRLDDTVELSGVSFFSAEGDEESTQQKTAAV